MYLNIFLSLLKKNFFYVKIKVLLKVFKYTVQTTKVITKKFNNTRKYFKINNKNIILYS